VFVILARMTKPRLWPAAVIAVLAALALAFTWGVGDLDGQQRTLQTGGTLILAWLALLVWLFFFSRLSRRARLAGGAVALCAVAVVAGLFRIRGVSGDFVPILEPRFARRPPLATVDPMVPAPTPPPTTLAGVPRTAMAPETAPSPVTSAPAPISEKPAPARGSYPGFLGATGDAAVPDIRLARDWAARAPRLRWRQPIGPAWSGFAVSGERAVTQEQRGEDELVTAYDLSTGRLVWAHTHPARYATTIAGVGPRATPAIAGGRVFTMGATGVLSALDLESGRRLWSRPVLAETGATLPEWGKAASPLVVDGRVVVSAGGPNNQSLVAYEGATGRMAWGAGTARVAYSSPRLAELAGSRQILMLNSATVSGHDAATGTLLWEHPFPAGQPNVATPAVLPGDRVLFSAGYGVGSRLFQITRDAAGALQPRLVWESPRLKSKFANLVVSGQHVYGLDDGVLTCIDPATGSRVWKDGRYGHGQMILAGGLLLVQTEEGEIVLIDPTPDGLRELTRFAALSDKTWNPPALAGALLVVRNDQEAAAYELPTE
jgi:outer membrane protein assembly factor BamB